MKKSGISTTISVNGWNVSMTNEKSLKRLPPYISYRTFQNFIGRLQQQVPDRIDRSYWGETLSGSTGTQLIAALRFLGLLDNNSKPESQLRLLVSARDEQKTGLLRQIISRSYGFVFQSSLDLQNATYGQLEEVFHSTFQLTPDVCRKCIKFFISLSADARLPLSPFMTKRFRGIPASDRIAGMRNIPKKARHKIKQNSAIPYYLEEIPEDMSWNSMLLAKFPTFDPNWSEEVKTKWFTAFGELLKLHPDGKDRGSTS